MNENNDHSIEKIVDNLFYISPMVHKVMRSSLRLNTNLNPISWWILKLLSRYDVLSMSEIGCKLEMPKPHVTAQIDKLIAEKMVERLDDPSDRRVVKIRMTELGAESHRQIAFDISKEMKERILLLDKHQIEQLEEASQKVRDILNEIMN